MNTENASPTAPASWLQVNEARLVLGFAVLLLAANVLTSLGYPTSWMDEAMFSDPAFHAATGKGLVSTAWWDSKDVTWSGNVPLYTVALIPWFKAFGFGLVRARLFNYLVISLTIPVLWLGVKRLGLVTSAGARLAFICTVFLSYTLSTNYRNVRPDCLGILICALALLAWSFENNPARNLCLFAAGCLVPASGLQLAAYAGFLCVFVFYLQRRQALAPICFAAAGVCAGGLALFAYYYANHLTGVLTTIRAAHEHLHFSAVNGGPEPTRLHLWMSKAANVFLLQAKEAGMLTMLLMFVVLLLDREIRASRELRFIALAGLVGSFLFTAFLEFFMHFRDYYHWMSYAIQVVAVFAILGRAWNRLNRFSRAAIALLLVGGTLGGMPLRVSLGYVMGEPAEYSRLKEAVARNLNPSDVVFTDFMAYFPARGQVAEVYLPPYGTLMTPQERDSVNVLILDPLNFDGYLHDFSGNGRRWKKVAEVPAESGALAQWWRKLMPNFRTKPQNCGYTVTILRSEPDANPSR